MTRKSPERKTKPPELSKTSTIESVVRQVKGATEAAEPVYVSVARVRWLETAHG